MTINRKDYDDWKENGGFDNYGRDAPAMAFKKVLNDKIDKLLSRYHSSEP